VSVARPHIEFVQEQSIPWRDAAAADGPPGTGVRVLSVDDETGAATMIVRYPPGWARSGPEHLTADEELVVLEGELELNGLVYAAPSYAFLPAGHVRRASGAPRGALVLAFYESEPRLVAGEASQPAELERLVERIDGLDGEWGGGFHPQFPAGAGRKWLRDDAESGDQTWILGTMPLRFGRKPEKHPVAEEMFLLSGEVVSPIGVMYPGAYIWRPPEVWHGPYGTKTGNLYVFRTKGGPLSTEYSDVEQDFDWHPTYAPVLPAGLAVTGGGSYEPAPRF
jgi:hypothetical protein